MAQPQQHHNDVDEEKAQRKEDRNNKSLACLVAAGAAIEKSEHGPSRVSDWIFVWVGTSVYSGLDGEDRTEQIVDEADDLIFYIPAAGKVLL